jgi:hypothetical protein
MNENYMTVTCQRCGSTSEILQHGVVREVTRCPVCEEGEAYRVLSPAMPVQERTSSAPRPRKTLVPVS